MTDVQITQLAKDELAARGLVINYEENNYAAGLYDGIIKGAQLERDNDNTVRSDNTQVIVNMQKEIDSLNAKLAPYERMEKEYARRCEENSGNETIVQDTDGHISVIFGEGKVLLSVMDGTLNRDNSFIHGIVLSALNCLRYAEIETIRDLVTMHRADLLKYRNFGKKSLTELDEFLEDKGLAWGMDVSDIPEYVNN